MVKNPPANAGDTDLIPDEEDPTRHGATKPMDWASALELRAATTELPYPRASAFQQERPPQWEAWASNEDPGQSNK